MSRIQSAYPDSNRADGVLAADVLFRQQPDEEEEDEEEEDDGKDNDDDEDTNDGYSE